MIVQNDINVQLHFFFFSTEQAEYITFIYIHIVFYFNTKLESAQHFEVFQLHLANVLYIATMVYSSFSLPNLKQRKKWECIEHYSQQISGRSTWISCENTCNLNKVDILKCKNEYIYLAWGLTLGFVYNVQIFRKKNKILILSGFLLAFFVTFVFTDEHLHTTHDRIWQEIHLKAWSIFTNSDSKTLLLYLQYVTLCAKFTICINMFSRVRLCSVPQVGDIHFGSWDQHLRLWRVKKLQQVDDKIMVTYIGFNSFNPQCQKLILSVNN